MGMTDKQFEAYQQSLLRDLQRIKKDVGVLTDAKVEELERLIADIESQLKRP